MSRYTTPSPDFSKLLTRQGFANIKLNHFQAQPSLSKPSIVKISLNKTLPPPIPRSESRSQSNQGNLTSRKKATIKPLSTRSGVTRLSLILLRPGFTQLKSNFKLKRRAEGGTKLANLFVKARINRMENGYNQLYRNMKKIQRLRIFASKFVKIYQRFQLTRKRIGFNRFSIFNNIVLERLIRNDERNKMFSFEGLYKRLVMERMKKVMVHFGSFSKLYRQQEKQLRRFPALFKNATQRNLVIAFHKLSVYRKIVKTSPKRPPRSLSKSIKTQSNYNEQYLAQQPTKSPYEEKYKQLEIEFMKLRKQLNARQQSLKKSQIQHIQLQKETKCMEQKVKIFEQQNKELKTKVQELSTQQRNLRQSRNSHRSSFEDEEIDFRDDKSDYSVNSKKSAFSNFSGRSLIENASAYSFNTMFMLKKLTGRTNNLKQCCQSKQLQVKLESKYNDLKTKYQLLEAEHQLMIQINKHLQLSLQGNIIGTTTDEEIERVKKENIELKATAEGYKAQVSKLKDEKDKMKKQFKKKLQQIYCKAIKKKSQSVN